MAKESAAAWENRAFAYVRANNPFWDVYPTCVTDTIKDAVHEMTLSKHDRDPEFWNYMARNYSNPNDMAGYSIYRNIDGVMPALRAMCM